MQKRFKTNLRCSACVEKIAPIFNGDPAIRSWTADVASPDKTLTVEGDAVDSGHVGQLLSQAGYQSLGEIESAPAPTITHEQPVTYFPLLLILAYLLIAVSAFEWSHGAWNWMRAMRHFMAGFFLIFSFFKLLDVPAFADSFSMYDIVAGRSRAYALAYPFIELALGVAYLAQFAPTATNIVTLIVMGTGAVGVVKSLLAKRKIRCACLGAVFNLPMSTITLVEDVLMAGMAAVMLLV